MAEALIVRSEDWPHGLRCGDCCRVLREGEPYAERWTGMMEEAPAFMIVCVTCENSAESGSGEGGA